MDHDKHNQHIEMKLRVLLYSLIGGIAVLLFWVLAMAFFGDFVYRVHTLTYEISRPQFDMIHYTGMMATKILISVFFLLPYISLKLALKKQKVS